MDPLTRQVLSTTGGKKSTYIDDVFSTYLYTGTGNNRAINNGIDLAGEGGMTWIKSTNQAWDHNIFDTERGAGKWIESNTADGQGTDATKLSTFNANGFNVESDGVVNSNGQTFSSWSFRKAPGFFDVVTWTGNGTGSRQIAHSLGSIPGCIMIKRIDGETPWSVYHRGIDISDNSPERVPADYGLTLNTTAQRDTADYLFSDTEPTATHFIVGTGSQVNGNGMSYVAYVFAGGESTAATARSVKFDSSGDWLSAGSSSDFTMGTGDFTVECWAKKNDHSHKGVWQISNVAGGLTTSGYANTLALGFESGGFQIYGGGAQPSITYKYCERLWYHTAYVRQSGVSKLYINGTEVYSHADTNDYNGTYVAVGGYYNTSYLHDGEISNFRVVKGTAVYTESFTPPNKPLTNITNTKLLCCNNASITGSTVTPGTINANGDPQPRTESPFDDIEGYKFGKRGDQNIIKCGGYKGSGDSDGPHIECGWQPQWILTKRAVGGTGNWQLYDSMRGIVDGNNDCVIHPDMANADNCVQNWIRLTPDGFKTVTNNAVVNGNTDGYIYMAIRRPDGYVGKPPAAGTDAFAMAYGSTTNPSINGGIPIDFAMVRQPATSENWYTGSRLTGANKVYTNLSDAMSSQSNFVWDYMDGWQDSSNGNYLSWMWKRGQGFDVVTYKGNSISGHSIPHSLSKVPEMAWIKNRDGTNDWGVYHKDMHSSIPEKYYMELNNDNGRAYVGNGWFFPPTSTVFKLGNDATVNQNNVNFIMMLFASVTGISKVGYYSGSASGQTITTGFQPRFVIIKSTSSSRNWVVFDTLRGWASGNDKELNLNTTSAQNNSYDFGAPTSTGFTITTATADVNASGNEYIYYAHA